MKFRVFIILFLLCFFVLPLKGEINGYFSFDYLRENKETSKEMFHNVQVGFIFSGEISSHINYSTELRISPGWEVKVDQALLRLRPSPEFQINLGLYLVPFGKYNQSSRPHQTKLVNLPLHVENLYPYKWRDIGILLKGEYGILNYSLYLGNGLAEEARLSESQQLGENNTNKAKGGRLGLKLSKELEVGYSHYRGKYDLENERLLSLHGVDFTWVLQGFQLLSEYTKALLENPENFSNGETQGYFVQFSFAWGNFHPVVSYQKYEYNDPYHGADFWEKGGAGGGIEEEESRWSLGVVYFPQKNILFKLEYDFNQEKLEKRKNESIQFQLALSF